MHCMIADANQAWARCIQSEWMSFSLKSRRDKVAVQGDQPQPLLILVGCLHLTFPRLLLGASRVSLCSVLLLSPCPVLLAVKVKFIIPSYQNTNIKCHIVALY